MKKNLQDDRSETFFLKEDLFRHFFEDSIVPMSITSCKGRVHVNRAFSKMLGYSLDEMNNLHWNAITFEEDISVSDRIVNEMLNHKISEAHFKKRYLSKNGSIIIAEVHTVPYFENTDCVYFLTTVIDITSTVEDFSEIQTLNHRYQTFINSSHDLIFLKDEQFRYLFVNDTMAGFYGMEISDIIGKTDYDLMTLHSAQVCRQTDMAALHSLSAVSSIEHIADQIYESTKFSVMLPNGKKGIGGYIRDVTLTYEQAQTIEQLSMVYRTIASCMMRPFQDKFEYLDFALHEALLLSKSQYGYIYYYDETKQEFTLNTWTSGVMKDCSVAEKQTKYILSKTGIWGEVVRQRKAIIVNDFDASNPLKKGYPEGHVSLHKFCSVPLFDEEKIVAVIGMANKEEDYTEHDINALTILMSGIWNTIEKREKEKETELLLDQMTSMFDNHKVVMLLIEPESGMILDCNPSATVFYGYDKQELIHMNIAQLSELPEVQLRSIRKSLLEKQMHQVSMTHVMKNKEKRVVDVYASIIPYRDHKAIYGIIVDVTEREQSRARILHISYHDYLTDLYNRRYFEEQFDLLNAQTEEPLSIIMGDVNGLKLVNDSLGHHVGDSLLIEASKLLLSHVDQQTIVARVGGDEFALLMKGKTEEQVKLLMAQLEEHNKSTIVNSGTQVLLSIAYGYAIQKQPHESLQSLMKEAEGFLYASKYYDDSSIKGKTVSIIMNTLFEKSEREKMHSQRVGTLASALAEKMNLSSQEINKVRTAGFLHDIGKIGIPEAILNKNVSLTNEEWVMMKSHGERSFRILQNSIEFADISEIVRSHHERWDGAGYNQSLRGENIPLASRIIALADAYDAMTNLRSYRNTLSKEEAISEIRRCSGTQFDPNLTDEFIAMLAENKW